MGSNRKTRQQQQHGNPSMSPAGGSKGRQSQKNTSHRNQDLYRQFSLTMQEGSEFGGGRLQIFWLMLVIGSAVSIFVLLGVALGMTISVHYYETSSPVAGKYPNRYDSYLMYSGLSAYQRVTNLDPNIASSNILHKKDQTALDLGKVVTTTDSGQLSVLMVVQEETPLHSDGSSSSSSSLPQSHHTSLMDNGPDHLKNSGQKGEEHVSMTIEQAESMLPGYSKYLASQPNLDVRQPSILPTLCSDGITYGFDDWNTLRAAIQEANSISAERFMKWSEYFATNTFTAFEDESLYYEKDVLFTICPGAVLTARKGPITINSENVVLVCEKDCVIDVRGTHLSFGANAKNVLVRGITFRSATSSSLTFFHDGAEALFEDCTWINNVGSSQKFGSVADINSTSIVNFHRCQIGFEKRGLFGSTATKMTSSLSIRAS